MIACALLLALAVVACDARPEPPVVGYQYQQPQQQPDYTYARPEVALTGSGTHEVSLGAFDVPPPLVQQHLAPTVQKHIYVHVPPAEPVEHRQQHVPHVGPPQKHYKIIFIKAPTPPTPVAPVIPLQQQNEEKTIVYVLVKKPDEQPSVVIPSPAPTQPSKPEVYFIKYKTHKEGGVADVAQTPTGADGPGLVDSTNTELVVNTDAVKYGPPLPVADTKYGPPNHVPSEPLH